MGIKRHHHALLWLTCVQSWSAGQPGWEQRICGWFHPPVVWCCQWPPLSAERCDRSSGTGCGLQCSTPSPSGCSGMTRNAETQQVHHLLKCGYGNQEKNAETWQMHHSFKRGYGNNERNAETQQTHHSVKCGYGNNERNAETWQMHHSVKRGYGNNQRNAETW